MFAEHWGDDGEGAEVRRAIRAAIPAAILAAMVSLSGRESGALICTNTWKDPVSGSWSDASKWSTGVVPAASDTACVTAAGTYTVTFTGGTSVAALSVGPSATFAVQGTTFDAGSVENAGTIALSSSGGFSELRLINSGTLTNTGTLRTNPGGARYLSGHVDNSGSIAINAPTVFSTAGRTLTNTGSLTIGSGSNLEMRAGSQSFLQQGGTLDVRFGDLLMQNGTFTFTGGTISGAPRLGGTALNLQSSGAARFTLEGNNTLQGDVAAGQFVTVLAGTTFYGAQNATLTATSSFTNAGTMVMTSAGSANYVELRIDNAGTAYAGTLTNNGTLSIAPGAGGARYLSGSVVNTGLFSVSASASFNVGGKTIANTGSLTVASGATFELRAGSQSLSQQAGTLDARGTLLVQGGTMTYSGGALIGTPRLGASTLNLQSGGAAAFSLEGPNTMSGDVVTGQNITVLAGSTFYGVQNATLTATSSFNNAGSIRLTSVDSANYAELRIDNGGTAYAGTLTNRGTLTVDSGDGGARYLRGHVANNNTIALNASTFFDIGNRTLTNTHTLTVAPGTTLEIRAGSQTLSQQAGTLDVQGTLLVQNGTFTYSGGTITGTPRLGGTQLNLQTSTPVSFSLEGPNTFSGNVAAGQNLTLLAGSTFYGFQNTTIVATSSFSNAGSIRMTSSGSPNYVELRIDNAGTAYAGTLTNTASLTIDAGAGGPRYMRGHVVNSGTIALNASTFYDIGSKTLTNTGTLTVAAGTTLEIRAGSQSLAQQAGTLDVQGTLLVQSATLTYSGGTITGTPRLGGALLNLQTPNAAGFLLEGPNTISGNVGPGQTITVLSGSTFYGAQNATVIASSSFTNAGTIRLTSVASPNYIELRIDHAGAAYAGSLTNTGALVVEAGAGGDRYIEGNLTNLGTATLGGASNIFLIGNKSLANKGTLSVPAGKRLTMTAGGQTLRNESPGAVTGGGAIDIASGTLSGTGVITATVNTVSTATTPGLSPGRLDVDGGYTQSGAPTTNIEIGGTQPGLAHDQLNVLGAATLTGTLNVSLVNGFVPSPCDEFRILMYGSRSGTFTAVNGLDTGGVSLRVVYTPTEVVLVAYPVGTKIGLTPTSVAVAEGGPSATYRACVGAQPSSPVTVSAAPTSQATVAPGAVTFTPASWDRTLTFAVDAVDDHVVEEPHAATITHSASSADPAFNGLGLPTVSVSIADNDHAPVALSSSVTTSEDTAVAAPLQGTDADGDSLTFTIVDPPIHGTYDGADYTPAADYHGADSFTFRASDGYNESDVATVTIVVSSVNDAPVAQNQSVQTPEDTPVTITLVAVDVDGDSVSYSVVSPPSHGTFDGTTYGPAADYNGSDAFSFKATDGSADSNEAVVSIEITPGNDAPDAVDDTAAARQYEPTVVAVLTNDTDIDGDTLAVPGVTQPAHGTATINPDGTVTYAPDPSFRVADEFTYTIADPSGATDTATVRIAELACGEDGLRLLDGTPAEGAASRIIDRDVEPAIAQLNRDAAAGVNRINCSVIVPAEDALES